MKWAAELEKWCWKEKARKASNSELFSMSRSLSGRQEISKDDMEKAVRDAVSSRPGRQQAQKNAVKDNLRRFDEQAQQELLNAFNELKQGSAGKKARGKAGSYHSPDENNAEESASDKSDTASVRQVAASILDELQKQFPENENLKKLKKKIRYIRNIRQLLDKIEKITAELDEYDRESTEQPELARGQGRIGGLSLQQGGKYSLPSDGFDRLPRAEDEKESFAGILTDDVAEDLKQEAHSPWLKDCPSSSLLDQVMNLGRKRRALEVRIRQQFSNEVNKADIQSMIDQLIESSIVSPTFKDTFLVNRERVAIQLAKEAFLQLSKMLVRKPLAQTGTHDYGRRGITTLQLDRVERSRSLTSRISPMHTLRQGLSRRALYQSSPLLDEEDLMNYESRAKVGYSIVIAIDISGAVQFGGRIKGVRKACMAFGYYLKKYHPRDRVTYIAYHEKPREVNLADVSRLKAINGTGKDIGGCLRQCLSILKRDPERVPAIVLIGDGLPVRGSQAGFYNFMNNNREVIDKAYYNARLLRKARVLFTFLQFREDRHLWEDYADEAATRIAREAKGLLYQIDDPTTIAPSLIRSFKHLRTIQ